MLRLVITCGGLLVLLGGAVWNPAISAEPPAEAADWVRDLQDDDPAVVVAAVEALGAQGVEAAAAVPRLGQLLERDNPDIRVVVAIALARIGVADAALENGLLQALEDQRQASTGHLVWPYAARTIGMLQLDVLPQLIAMLEDERPQLHRAAALALYGYGADAKPAVPALVRRLEEDVPETRRAIIEGLMGIGPAAAKAVPALIKMLESEDFHTQYWACRALGRIGAPAATPAVPQLIVLLRQGAASVRGNAAAALGQIGPQAGPEIVTPLATALQDRSHNVRQAAAVSLGQLGALAQDAGPALQAALADEQFTARTAVAMALWSTTDDRQQVLATLIQELQSSDEPWEAAAAFGQLGEQAAPAVPRLKKLLSHEAVETRVYTAAALAGIGAPSQDALPDLTRLLTDQNEDVRAVAAEAIAQINKAAAPDVAAPQP